MPLILDIFTVCFVNSGFLHELIYSGLFSDMTGYTEGMIRLMFPQMSWSSGSLEVGLFDAAAEGQEVTVALYPLGQLCGCQSGGQNGEQVPEH